MTSRLQPGPQPATSSQAKQRIFLGTSGWAYSSWKPGFYPPGASAKKFLSYYSEQLNSVEVNYTFRALPTAAMCERWLADTPADFLFTFKAPQRITHFQRLRESAEALAEFIAALSPFSTAGKLGLVLFQLPPNFKADQPRLRDFLAEWSHMPQVPLAAFEFRHESWFSEETYAALREHGCALCIAASDELETPEVFTANHVAYRLRRTDYSDAEIAELARKFQKLAVTHNIFAYFKHLEEPTGAVRAVAVRTALGTPVPHRAKGDV
ncbi:MAG TPA: DUF72 domain-containing protein [Acidobacteriaceae bacterium]